MPPIVKLLTPADADLLTRVADGVFDRPVDPDLTADFLDDPCHHLAVAIDDRRIVAMASAVDYIHPDKPPQLFINEIAVAPTHRRQGLATALLNALLAVGLERDCTEAWVLTERHNHAAMQLYKAAGGNIAPQEQTMFTFSLSDPPPPNTLQSPPEKKNIT